jgi:hypothetical protein
MAPIIVTAKENIILNIFWGGGGMGPFDKGTEA